MINSASVVIGGGNWGIKEADVLGYKLINSEYYARDIDFANSTADGTYMDSTGYVRRSPYNLFTYSEELDNVLWLKNNITIVPNAGIAPNNTYTADSYASTTTVGPHPCYQSKVVTRNTYTYSVYVQKVNSRYVSLKGAGGMTVWTGVIFDLDTASVVSIQNNNIPGTTGAITSEGNGWYRISMTATSNFNDFGLQYASSPSNTFGNYGDLSIAGSGLVDYLLWGMQVVQGSSPMPYFYTTTRLNVPRIDYRNADGSLSTTGRLLLEPQRTNSIRNSSMVGAVAGSPGTLPTNWAFNNDAGLTRTIIGVGVENGLPYFDIRFNGTATSTFSIELRAEQPTQIAALTGQAWSHSVYMRYISSAAAPSSVQIGMYERTSGGSAISSGASTTSLTSSLQRFTLNHTLSGGATVAFIQPYVAFLVNNATAYDFTIRIAAPQMELGAYATTWIPTTTATVTRNADAASRTGVSSWIGQEEGTLFIDIELPQLTGPSSAILISLGGPTQPRIYIAKESSTTNVFQLGIQNAAGNYNYVNTAAITTPNIKFAIAYASGNNAFYVNGALISTASANANATSLSSINMGAITTVHQYKINQAIIFPNRLTNSQLQSLTTL